MTNAAQAGEPAQVSGDVLADAGAPQPIRIEGLRHAFGPLQVIDDLDLEVAPGEIVALVGPSGCGKTTLMELISGLRSADAGAVSVGGRPDVEGRLSRCVYMPQRDLLLPWLSAIDNASLALRVRGEGREQARSEVVPAFRRLGLAGFEETRPAELSGGMRQRVAFLRTLASRKPVLLLDEPFASLDAITRAEMQAWLAGVLTGRRRTVVLVTHDVEEALYLADRVAVLSARPAHVMGELALPSPRARDRAAAVTSSEFADLRERALRALEGHSR